MPRILAVNNYPTTERFDRLEKCLRESGAEVTSAGWSKASASLFGSFDGVVLSGSPDMMSDPRVQAKFASEVQAIADSDAPILGVCFGHQMMAHAFGARIVKDGKHILEMVQTQVLADDPLFDGLPRSMMLLESRHEVVESLPRGFRLLATSATSEIAAMRHTSRQAYGVQFHPERYTKENPDGKLVLRNFARLLR